MFTLTPSSTSSTITPPWRRRSGSMLSPHHGDNMDRTEKQRHTPHKICQFFNTPAGCKLGAGCPDRHITERCRFDGCCKRPGCGYVHVLGQQRSMMASSASSSSSSSLENDQDAPTMKTISVDPVEVAPLVFGNKVQVKTAVTCEHKIGIDFYVMYDLSDDMVGSRLWTAMQMTEIIVDHDLRRGDRISLIGFNDEIGQVELCPLTAVEDFDKSRLDGAAERLQPMPLGAGGSGWIKDPTDLRSLLDKLPIMCGNGASAHLYDEIEAKRVQLLGCYPNERRICAVAPDARQAPNFIVFSGSSNSGSKSKLDLDALKERLRKPGLPYFSLMLVGVGAKRHVIKEFKELGDQIRHINYMDVELYSPTRLRLLFRHNVVEKVETKRILGGAPNSPSASSKSESFYGHGRPSMKLPRSVQITERLTQCSATTDRLGTHAMPTPAPARRLV